MNLTCTEIRRRFYQIGLPKYCDDRFIQQQGAGGIQTAFDQVKGQKSREQEAGNGFSGISHIERGDQIIPEQHERSLADHTTDKAGDSARQPASFSIDTGCSAGKSAAGYDIHEKAQETGAAYGEHLHERDQKCDQCCRKGIENKSAGHYDDILGIIAQEKYDRNPKYGRRKEGEGAEHADCCEFLCCVVHFSSVPEWFALLKKLTPKSRQCFRVSDFRCVRTVNRTKL